MSDLLTVAEVSQILRVDSTTTRRWIKQGALEAVCLPHVRERQSYRIRRETLDNLLAGTYQKPAPRREETHGRGRPHTLAGMR